MTPDVPEVPSGRNREGSGSRDFTTCVTTNAMKSIGIQIANGSVRVAAFSGSRRKPRLSAGVDLPLPPGTDAGPVLARGLEEARLSPRRACVSLGGEGSIIRRLRLPVSNARAASRAVRFQAEDLLCGDTLEDVVIDHRLLGPRPEGGMEALVLVARKADVGRALDVLRTAGIENGEVTLDGASLFNLASAAGRLPREGRSALLSFEGDRLGILLAEGGALELFRCTPLSPDGGTGEPAADTAARELDRTLAGAGIEDPLARILVSGPEAETVADALSANVPVPVEVLDPASSFGAEPPWRGSAAAAGAALKGLEAEALPVDLLKDDFAPRGERRRVYHLALYGLGALALLFAILLGGEWRRLRAVAAERDEIVREEQQCWKRVFPDKPFPRVGFLKYATSIRKKPSSEKRGAARYASFLDALKKAAEASPGEGIQVQAITFDQRKVVLAGEVDGMDRLESLANNLKERFGLRVKPRMERRARRRGEVKTLFRIEIPRS